MVLTVSAGNKKPHITLKELKEIMLSYSDDTIDQVYAEIKSGDKDLDIDIIREMIKKEGRYNKKDEESLPKALRLLKKTNPSDYNRVSRYAFKQFVNDQSPSQSEEILSNSYKLTKHKRQRLENDLSYAFKLEAQRQEEKAKQRAIETQDKLKRQRFLFYASTITGIITTVIAAVAPLIK